MKGYSQQLQFIHDDRLFNISFNFSCRDFNASLKLYAVIKIRAKLKTAQLADFLLCRDIKLLVATYSTFGGTSHLMAATATFPLCVKMSRQLPLGGIALVATSAFFFLQY